MNVYVLAERDHLLVIDSGLAVHREAVLEQLAELGADRAKVSFLPIRYGEFNSLCNYPAIAERFGVFQVFGDTFGPPQEWLDFMPTPVALEALAGATVVPAPTTSKLRFAPPSTRRLETFQPPLWLLPTSWAYDADTKTLFTADVFTWVYRDSPEGAWTVDAETDETTAEDVWRHLSTNTYWWLPGARIDGMRKALAETFERFEVETIAPGFGCILDGKATVDRHVQLLDQVLERAAAATAHGVEVGSWRFGEEVNA